MKLSKQLKKALEVAENYQNVSDRALGVVLVSFEGVYADGQEIISVVGSTLYDREKDRPSSPSSMFVSGLLAVKPERPAKFWLTIGSDDIYGAKHWATIAPCLQFNPRWKVKKTAGVA